MCLALPVPESRCQQRVLAEERGTSGNVTTRVPIVPLCHRQGTAGSLGAPAPLFLLHPRVLQAPRCPQGSCTEQMSLPQLWTRACGSLRRDGDLVASASCSDDALAQDPCPAALPGATQGLSPPAGPGAFLCSALATLPPPAAAIVSSPRAEERQKILQEKKKQSKNPKPTLKSH